MNSTLASQFLQKLLWRMNPATAKLLDPNDPIGHPDVQGALHVTDELLGIVATHPAFPVRHRHPWDPGDKAFVRTLHQQAVDPVEIARQLGRSTDAVKAQLGLPVCFAYRPTDLPLPSRAAEILLALVRGKDPVSGNPLPADHVCLDKEVWAAIVFGVNAALMAAPFEYKGWSKRQGAEWTEAEVEQLRGEIAAGIPPESIAAKHERSAAAIEQAIPKFCGAGIPIRS